MGTGLFIASESLFIFTVHKLGWAVAATLYSVFYSALCLMIFRWFHHEATTVSRVGNVTRWIIAKGAAVKTKYHKLFKTSAPLAIFLLSPLVGVFVVTVVIGLLGYTGKRAYMMLIIQTIECEILWALIYAGALHLVIGK